MSDTKMETWFTFIKDCLLTFNYPLAHSMNNEELGEIFNPSNRCFLICWMLKVLDSVYEEVLENIENDKEILGNIVYELGFCTQKEKMLFMRGELSMNKQVRIIYNMFTFIMDVKKCSVEEKQNVTNDDLCAVINTNLNLFPMYGDIKLLKPAEKSSKLADIEKEIADIKIQLPEEEKPEPIQLMDNKFSDDIVEFLEKIKEEFPKIKAVVQSFNRNKDVKAKDVIEVHPNSVEILRECSRQLKIISQFIKDINTINDFEEANSKVNVVDEQRNSEIYDMVKVLYQEVLNVRNILRSTRKVIC